jgi:hypothetical protein
MPKLFVIVVTLLFVTFDVGLSQSPHKKPRRKRHLTSAASSWPPEKDSLLYKYTRELPVVDSVEVSEVQYARSPTSNSYETRVIKSITIHGAEAERFAYVWRKLDQGMGMACFSPAYRVTFFAKETPLLGSTICFHCHNLTLPEEGRGELYPFDADGKTGQSLLKVIQSTLANAKISPVE